MYTFIYARCIVACWYIPKHFSISTCIHLYIYIRASIHSCFPWVPPTLSSGMQAIQIPTTWCDLLLNRVECWWAEAHSVFPWLFDDVKRSLLAMVVSIHQWRCNVPNLNLQKVLEKPKWHTWDAHLLRKWVEPYCFCTYPEQADGWILMKWSFCFRQRCLFVFSACWNDLLHQLEESRVNRFTGASRIWRWWARHDPWQWGLEMAPGMTSILGKSDHLQAGELLLPDRKQMVLIFHTYDIMYLHENDTYTDRHIAWYVNIYTLYLSLGSFEKAAFFQADFVAPRASWDLQRCGVKQHKSSAWTSRTEWGRWGVALVHPFIWGRGLGLS